MGRLNASLLALAVIAALSLSACGEERADLLPGGTASEINSNLDLVQQQVDEGECIGAAAAAQEVSTQIDALGGVDKELKQALREGAARLNEVVTQCEEDEEEPEETEAVETAEEPEEFEKPEKAEKAEKEQQKQEAKEAEATLPPQAEGKAKGKEKEVEEAPEEEAPAEEPSGGTPSGGLAPAEEAGAK
jgi:outer membrane biosynthesis protein TonB